jgi:hypothetical protein
MLLAALSFALAGRTAFAGPSSVTDYEKIQISLEYNKRMVGIIDNYLKDRSKIPADYQAVSDKEFLRRAAAEKPLATMADAKPPRGVSAADQPQEAMAKPAKSQAKPASSKPPRY